LGESPDLGDRGFAERIIGRETEKMLDHAGKPTGVVAGGEAAEQDAVGEPYDVWVVVCVVETSVVTVLGECSEPVGGAEIGA